MKIANPTGTLEFAGDSGISNDEMPSHIESLFSTLRGSFGLSGDTLSKTIIKRMWQKAEVPFYEVGYRPMIEYVQELKKIVEHRVNRLSVQR